MKTKINKQILILMLAVSVLCLAIVVAIVGNVTPDSAKNSESQVHTATVSDESAIAAQALSDAKITMQESGVDRVGDLDEENSEDTDEEIISFASDTSEGETENTEDSIEDDSETIAFATAVADDGEEYEIIDFEEDGLDVLSASGNILDNMDTNANVTGVGGANFDVNNIDWNKAIMVNVKEYANVRTEPDANSDRAGKMEIDDVGIVLSVTDDWVHMVSGELEGYIKKDLCFLGEDAKERANEVCKTVAVSTTNGLRIRKGPSQDDGVIRNVEKGAKLTVAKAKDVDTEYDENEWVPVKSGNAVGFVAKEYVEVTWDIGVGMTVAEEEAIRKEKEEAAKKGKASTNTDDLILLAALIEGEGNGQPYEGKVAIANVVLNRVNSGGYPNSIYNVIYQPGQFGPALSGKVARIVYQGPSAANKDAAAAALGGLNYIGGCTHFKPVSSGMPGAVIGGHVFY